MIVKFIRPDKTREFKNGQLLEAKYPVDIKNKKWIAIKNRFGETYGYPTYWFEIIDERDSEFEQIKRPSNPSGEFHDS